MAKTVIVFTLVGLTVIAVTPFGIIALLFSLFGLKKIMFFLAYKVAQTWAFILIGLSGSRVTVTGKENIPKKGGVCFVCNHGSIFDIIINLAYIGRPFGFIAKKELLLLPFLNAWILILGGLFIDRKNPKKGLKVINKGIKHLKKGGNILIFPEGSRSRGQGLLPFKPGSFKLATQSGVPIIPVAISGSYDVFERNHRIKAVPVRIVFGPLISLQDMPLENRKQILAEKVRGIIEAALNTET